MHGDTKRRYALFLQSQFGFAFGDWVDGLKPPSFGAQLLNGLHHVALGHSLYFEGDRSMPAC